MVFADAGLRVLKSPPQAPKANAHCERMIDTLRRDLLDRTLILHEQHLRRTLSRYLEHYNTARPHRGIGQLCQSSSCRWWALCVRSAERQRATRARPARPRRTRSASPRPASPCTSRRPRRRRPHPAGWRRGFHGGRPARPRRGPGLGTVPGTLGTSGGGRPVSQRPLGASGSGVLTGTRKPPLRGWRTRAQLGGMVK
ncbi:integrase core domain-containing protein [Nonomuraea sp. CA-141351]|uniref:integrase core domain-containing protein n=1 Tax=Nonomuraea sp. CA-141351 TaxID=3239996 RepID=UPI003D94835C